MINQNQILTLSITWGNVPEPTGRINSQPEQENIIPGEFRTF